MVVFIKTGVLLFAGLLSCAVLASSEDTWISTSKGVYLLGNPVPVLVRQVDKRTITAFKSVLIEDDKLLVVWGGGRHSPGSTKKIASMTLSDIRAKKTKTLFKTQGPRLRDFIVTGDNIIAVGHDNADVHLYSLKTNKHTVLHIPFYENGFNHSIRSGDVDNDGVTEYYITVTTPNVAGGLGQEGKVVRLDVDWKTLKGELSTVIDVYDEYDSNVKEVAVFDIDGDSVDDLIVEVAPQIEVYGPNNIEYIEPTIFLVLHKEKEGYVSEVMAESNIRLGRILNYDDIDGDGLNELFFIDYYESGIYVLETKNDPMKAKGINVDDSDSDWALTKIEIKTAKGENAAFTGQLKSNHIIYLHDTKQLVASNNSSKDFKTKKANLLVPAVPMSLHYFSIVKSEDSYCLQPGKVEKVGQSGEVWQLNTQK